MTVGTTPLGSSWREGSTALTLLVEAALVVAVIAVLSPLFARLASQDTGRDGRFAAASSVASAAEAPGAAANPTKDEAMRALLRTARWQWSAWALLGLLLLNAQRSRVTPAFGVGLAFAAWAVAAWAGR